MRRAASRLLFLLATVAPSAGCVAAAAAGAGSAIYLTSRGAEGVVNGSVSDVTARSRAVMTKEGITEDAQSSEKGGDEQELKGKKGDLDVTFHIKRETASTSKVEVTARENLAEWDKKYAEQLLNEVVAKK
ncbi:MAG TPA: hypothetical protein VJQ44_08320 [Gemmatimonadales bacterium]|nr:hypothetical protein [Gemmatimonadales bacterium]